MNTDGVLQTAARDENDTHLLIKPSHMDQFEKEDDNVSEILKKMR